MRVAALVLAFRASAGGFAAVGPGLLELPIAAAVPVAAAQRDAEEPQELEDEPERLRVYEAIEVEERGDSLLGIAAAASEGSTGHADLGRRPILRAGEIVETVPGLIATQHSGGGKANQYFLRGFNLDHGTDFGISVAGVPVNLPSHGHGQGYADLNFLIPELVDRVAYRKGTYSAAAGDFSSAGGAEIEIVEALPKGWLELGGGGHGFGRTVVADSFAAGGGDLLAAVELQRADGPWQRGDDYGRANGVARFSRGEAAHGFSVTAMAHSGSWLSTDQIPRRAVEQGLLDRYGLVDPGARGETGRFSLAAEMHRGDAGSLSSLAGYLLRYELDLFSNFTYVLDDPENGDQFEQADERWVGGLAAERTWQAEWGGRAVELLAGADLSRHDIANGLYRTRELERLRAVRADEIEQWSAGGYGEATVRWNERVRTTLGLRAQGYRARVASDLPVNSGTRDSALLLPKLSAAFGLWPDTELYAGYGWGFHSNDARGTTIRVDPATGAPAVPVDPLVRTTGAELGLRSAALPGLQTSLSAFLLELDSELLFVGDGGTTEASRPSRRVGLEWTNHLSLGASFFADLDVAVTRARFADEDPSGDRIPGALEHVVAAGIAYDPAARGGRWFGGVRLRYFSGYPLIEDGSVEAGSTALVNALVGAHLAGGLTLRLEGFNLLDREDSDIEYLYASRLPGEPLGGVEDVHFHPVEKPSARLSVRWEH